MHRSTPLARVITIVIAVILAPIATGILAAGGSQWRIVASQYGVAVFDLGRLGGPVLLQALGILLLAGVVVTGIWSSGGLIAAGILTLVPLACAVFPALLFDLYRLPLPSAWIDGIAFGIPLFVFPALGAMGIVLALVRRRPARNSAGSAVVGLIASPVLLLAGAWVLAWGIQHSLSLAILRFIMAPTPEGLAGTGAVLAGVLLIGAGVVLTRWSTFALVLPAVVLLVASLLALQPGMLSLLAWPSSTEVWPAMLNQLLLGTGTAVAILYLVFTGALLVVRARAGRTTGEPSPPAAPPASYPGVHYPPAP